MNLQNGRWKLDKVNVLLKLYVATADQKFLAFKVKRVLGEIDTDRYLFVTIDVRVIPRLAEMDNVVATPTLVRVDLERDVAARLVGRWRSDRDLKRFLLGVHGVDD